MKKKTYTILVTICLALIGVCAGWFFLSPFSQLKDTYYIYIDADDNADSVQAKLSPVGHTYSNIAYNTLVRHSSYAENVKTGRYAIAPDDTPIDVFRRLKGGRQTPLLLTIPSVRTTDRLSQYLGEKLMTDSAAFMKAFGDSVVCNKYGCDTATVICLFIPNTYEVYWDLKAEQLMERMKKEHDTFWNGTRQQQAAAAGLSEHEVQTLASIVDEETANDAEKPMIAGMYINRLKKGMPLQADPTVKYAWRDFGLRRIYNKLLAIDSPYNTYKYEGLPPGPIRIASVAGIDAVLNYVPHDYLYMCAKEDFSGTHNFAVTYREHLANAAKYVKALNKRGIK